VGCASAAPGRAHVTTASATQRQKIGVLDHAFEAAELVAMRELARDGA